MNLDLALFLLSILAFISILLYNPACHYGIPALLIFMGVGMVLGNGGFDKFICDYPGFTNTISSLPLNLVIFSGGLHTSINRIKPFLAEGLTLSTVGVLATAFMLGSFISMVTGLISVVLFSVLIQGTTIGQFARLLQLEDKRRDARIQAKGSHYRK